MNKTLLLQGSYDLEGEIKEETINTADVQGSKRNTEKGCRKTEKNCFQLVGMQDLGGLAL